MMKLLSPSKKWLLGILITIFDTQDCGKLNRTSDFIIAPVLYPPCYD